MHRIEVVLYDQHAPADARFFPGALGSFLRTASAVVEYIARF
jgi:hypothetical protein